MADAARCRVGLVSVEDLFDPSPWNSRHDSRCRANSDSRLSCTELQRDVTGTMAALGIARRGEWTELRRLLGRDRPVLREAERERLIEVDVDVCDSRRSGPFPGGSILFTLGVISDGDIGDRVGDLHPWRFEMVGSHLEIDRDGSRARHVTEAISLSAGNFDHRPI